MNYVHYEDSFLCSRDEPSICNMYVKERGGETEQRRFSYFLRMLKQEIILKDKSFSGYSLQTRLEIWRKYKYRIGLKLY